LNKEVVNGNIKPLMIYSKNISKTDEKDTKIAN